MTLVIDLAYNNSTTRNVNGQDVNFPPDWSKVSPLPDAVLTKASEWQEDFTFAPNWHAAGALGIPRAAYHFYHNGQIIYNSARQAKKFTDIILKNGFNDNDYFVIDNEEDGKFSAHETVDFLYNVQINLGLKDTSHLLLYSRALILNGAIVKSADALYLKKIRTWVGDYPDVPPADGWQYPNYPAYQLNSNFGPTVTWQYKSEAPNVSNIPGGVDLNQIDPDFLAEWRAGVVPQPTPQVPNLPQNSPSGAFPANFRVTVQPDGSATIAKE
jgi:GH25 family lysozyme M1 (1,4-beta-N-acetylmuramidase)